jgi:hypothetical protein
LWESDHINDTQGDKESKYRKYIGCHCCAKILCVLLSRTCKVVNDMGDRPMINLGRGGGSIYTHGICSVLTIDDSSLEAYNMLCQDIIYTNPWKNIFCWHFLGDGVR